MSATELLLIDMSGLAHQLFHVSGNEPDPSFISQQLLVKVRQLAHQHPHAAVCLDSGKSFRHDLEPSYKAQRDTENRGVIKHQIDAACTVLKAEGFPVWAAKGYEADDIIATAARAALEMDDEIRVLIASADKDLLQLVSDRVRAKSTHPQSNGEIRGPAEVREKYGIEPWQMNDWLCLVGDASDNVKGAQGIGNKRATELLAAHGTLAAIYERMADGDVPGMTKVIRTSLAEFKPRWPLVRELITLKTDAPIDISEIAAERGTKPMANEPSTADVAEFVSAGNGNRESMTMDEAREMLPILPDQEPKKAPEPSKPTDGAMQAFREAAGPVRTELVRLAPRDFSQELEPRDMNEAVRLAQRIFDSRLFGAYGTPQAVLAVILSGRELGMGAMKSLKTHHIMDGKAVESADLIAGQVLSSGKAKYFRPTFRDDTKATFTTLRVGDDEPFTMTYTIEEARKAWRKDDRAWAVSGWGKNPADMLVARCKSKLARLVYPDVVSGLYAPEEFES